MRFTRWIITAIVVTALLAGAHRIVAQRNAVIASAGQTSSPMPMH